MATLELLERGSRCYCGGEAVNVDASIEQHWGDPGLNQRRGRWQWWPSEGSRRDRSNFYLFFSSDFY